MKRSLMLMAVGLCACGGGGGGAPDLPDPIPGQFAFSAATYAAGEGVGNAVVTVRRTGGSDGAVSVAYASGGGSAEVGADYAAASGRLNWPDGDISPRSVSVSLVNDSLRESDETVTLSLSAPGGGAVLGAVRAATLTIHDDEPAMRGQLQFNAAGYTVAENGGSILILVTRSGGIDGEVGVSYATADGSAHAGADYTPASGTLGWLDGDDSAKGIVVPVADDSLLDGDKVLTLTLSAPTGGAALGTPRGVTLTIRDNEVPQPGQLQFSAPAYVAAENTGTATITVMRSGGSYGAVSVSYASSNGTAQAGTDYSAVSGTLNWSANDASARTFTVPLTNDTQREGDKTVMLVLSTPGGGAALGATRNATLTIRDDEPAQPGQLQFSAASYAADESVGSVVITVTRTGGKDGAVSLSYASGTGSAQAGTEYTAVSGALRWGDGDAAAKTFFVALKNDSQADGDKTVPLSLSAPAGGVTLGAPSNATLTIRDDEVPLALVNAVPGLSFDQPVFLTAAPGDATRLYVVERGGRIRVFENNPASTAAGSFLDINSRVLAADLEEGLLGLAFDPDFATNGFFYVNYIADNPVRTVVSRFTAVSRDAADPASEFVLLTVDRGVNCCHNGGWLGFGPDGKLYITSGDNGESDKGQRLDTLLGKVLRINKDGSVPADNPFRTTVGARPEIWAYGFRNPWRASFDRGTGELWLGDVGESSREEIDLVEAGGNYGWALCEGMVCNGTPPAQYRPPLLDYGRDLGGSVTGGYVYRGGAIPAIGGHYVYADFASGRIWLLQGNGASLVSREIGMVSYPGAFGEDAAGELYVLSFFDGNVFRLQRQ